MKAAGLSNKAFEAWAAEDGQKEVVIGSRVAQAGQVEVRSSTCLRRCGLTLAVVMALAATLGIGTVVGTFLARGHGSDSKQGLFLAPSPAPAPAPAPSQAVEPREPSDSKSSPGPCVQGVLSLSVNNASAFINDTRARHALRATIASTSRRVKPEMVQVDAVHLARRLSVDNSTMLQRLQVDYTILVPRDEEAKVIADEVLAVPTQVLTSRLASDMKSMGVEGAVEVTNVTGNVPLAANAVQTGADVELTVLKIGEQGPGAVERPEEEKERPGLGGKEPVPEKGRDKSFEGQEPDRKHGDDEDGSKAMYEKSGEDYGDHGKKRHGKDDQERNGSAYDKDGERRSNDSKVDAKEKGGQDGGQKMQGKGGKAYFNEKDGSDKHGKSNTSSKGGKDHGKVMDHKDGFKSDNRSGGKEGKDRTEGGNRTSKGGKDCNKTHDHEGHGKMDANDHKDQRRSDFATGAPDPEGSALLGEEIRSTGLGSVAQTATQHAVLEAASAARRLLTEATDRADLLGGIVRLAFHDAGTWDEGTSTGGADGCVDLAAAENKGLESVIAELSPIVEAAVGNLSRADVWILSANVAIEFAGGPKLEFEAGRVDQDSCLGFAKRLPDAEQGHLHIEQFFVDQLKFSARDVAALMGAHVLGSAQAEHSGYSGSWVPRNDRFSNEYFRDLLNVRWDRRSRPSFGGEARTQWQGRGNTMMLNTDIELAFDTSGGCMQAGGRSGGCPRAQHAFSAAVSEFATQQGERAFFETFAPAWKRLASLGSSALRCPFQGCGLPAGAAGREVPAVPGGAPSAPGRGSGPWQKGGKEGARQR